jgi:hypothetical protein
VRFNFSPTPKVKEACCTAQVDLDAAHPVNPIQTPKSILVQIFTSLQVATAKVKLHPARRHCLLHFRKPVLDLWEGCHGSSSMPLMFLPEVITRARWLRPSVLARMMRYKLSACSAGGSIIKDKLEMDRPQIGRFHKDALAVDFERLANMLMLHVYYASHLANAYIQFNMKCFFE